MGQLQNKKSTLNIAAVGRANKKSTPENRRDRRCNQTVGERSNGVHAASHHSAAAFADEPAWRSPIAARPAQPLPAARQRSKQETAQLQLPPATNYSKRGHALQGTSSPPNPFVQRCGRESSCRPQPQAHRRRPGGGHVAPVVRAEARQCRLRFGCVFVGRRSSGGRQAPETGAFG